VRSGVADHVASVAAEPGHRARTGGQGEGVQLNRHILLRHLRNGVEAMVVCRIQTGLHRTAVRSNLCSLLLEIR
jgi:hypothetical protein